MELLNRTVDIVFVRDTPNFGADIRDSCIKRFSRAYNVSDCSVARNLFNLHRAREDRLVERLKSDFPLLGFFNPF